MFNFLRRKPKEENKALHSIHTGAWSRVLEPFAGAWQRNIEVRLDSVLAYPAIFSCISLISSDIAKMPMAVKRRQSNGVWVRVNNPVLTPLLEKPNFYQTPMQFFELWMISKLAHGNAYILKLRDEADRVRQLRVLDPRRVIPYISDDGEIFYSILTDELNGLPGGLYVPARELIHDRFNTFFHPLCGLSPIYASGLAAVGGEAMLRNSAHTFKNGGKPGGIITVPGSVDKDKAAEIRDNWNTGYTGENAGKTALLADGASFVAVAQTATDAQLVEQLNMSNQLVASTFRVPLYKIDTGQTPSYNNIEALEQAYYSQCLQVHMTAIEGLIADTFDLDAQTCVEFDHSRLLRMDTAARYKSYGDGIGAGFLAPNEARIKENMQPVEGGDTPYLQQQNFSLEALAKRDAQDNPFSTGSSSPASDDDDTIPAEAANDPTQPPSQDDARHFLFLLNSNGPTRAPSMITEREAGFAELIRQSFDTKVNEVIDLIGKEFENKLSEKENLIAAELDILREADDKQTRFFEKCINDQFDVETLKDRIADLEKSSVDEAAIASMVYAQIEIPDAPVLPDIGQMVKEAVNQITFPEPQPLPNIDDIVLKAVLMAKEGEPTIDDLRVMVKEAVDAIELPQPEPVIPPDIDAIINEVVSQLVIPQPEPIPDIKGMVMEAVSSLPVPQAEPLPDIGKMVQEAVSRIELPQPEPLPDIKAMVMDAVSSIPIPQPEPLPDIGKMVQEAVSRIELPEPEPIPDVYRIVKEAFGKIEFPKPQPLPDFQAIIKAAVDNISFPKPEPLPDIQAMVKTAVDSIVIPEVDVKQLVDTVIKQLPEPEQLPDIEAMIQKAVSDIPIPEPEPLSDVESIVIDAVKEAVNQIQIPQPEPLPDLVKMISDQINLIPVPQAIEPEPLPDIDGMVTKAVMTAVDQIELPKPEALPDIQAMIQQAVNQLTLPQPEPLPDIQKMIQDGLNDAIANLVIPEPEPLPDLEKMVNDAVSAIEIPQPKEPEPLPDIAMLLERAVSEYPMPEPEPLPDFNLMIKNALAEITLPEPKEPEPLPDIAALVAGAVAGIQFPDPEPVTLPDFEKMISEAVTKAVADIKLPEPDNGKDGKDGLQIEVIPEIDPNKRYPRGTYAIHNGGLWRAYQNTAGLSGFECVVNGLNDIDVNVSDERHFTVKLSKSNGETEERSFDIPVMIYRDVYQPGRKYYPGDCVTFAGSVWHCHEETADRPNEAGSTGWKLAVKRGRDARSRE